jgi:hypothetical protein
MLSENIDLVARKEVIKEEVAAVKADQDQELLKIAQSLLTDIKALPGVTHIIQAAMGD